MTKATQNSLFYALLALLVFLPLPYGSNRPMYWAISEVAIFILFAIWLINASSAASIKSTVLHKVSGPVILLIIICLWIFLQASGVLGFKSIDTHATYAQFIKSVSYLCLFILTVALVNSHPKIRMLAWTLLLSGTFQAVYGTLIAVTEQTSATGSFINRNHLAGYLELTLAVGIGLLIADLNRDGAKNWREGLRRWINALLGPKAPLRICLALMVIGLILTQSRMGNAAFFAALMIAGIVGLIIFRKSSRSVVLLFSSLIIIDTFLMGAFFGIDKLQDRIEKTDLLNEQRIVGNRLAIDFLRNAISASPVPRKEENRSEIADGATEAMVAKHPPVRTARVTNDNVGIDTARPSQSRDSPETPAQTSLILFGTGVGTYYTFFPLYRGENIHSQNLHAHNDFFELAMEFGALGSVLLLALVTLTMITAVIVQVRRRSRLMQAMGFASMMAIIALMIHSFADFNLQIYANAATFVVILSLPYIALDTHADKGHKPLVD